MVDQLILRPGLPGGGFQNSGDVADSAVHGGQRWALSGADVAGIHRTLTPGGLCVWQTANRGLVTRDDTNTSCSYTSRAVSGRGFVLTGRGNGHLWRTSDFGLTWQLISSSISGNAATQGTGTLRPTGRNICDDPGGSYVWVSGYTGNPAAPANAAVWRSTDGGATIGAWGLTGRDIRSVVQDPQNGDVLYMAQEAGAGGGLLKVTNARAAAGVAPVVVKVTGSGGLAAGTALTSIRDCQVVVEGTKTWVYFIAEATTLGGANTLWKVNGTDVSTLTEITGTLSTASLWSSLDVYRSGTNSIVWATCYEARKNGTFGEAVVVSRDSGTTWNLTVTHAGTSKNMPSGLHWWHMDDSPSVAVNKPGYDGNWIRTEPGNRGVVFVGGRGGVWRTADDGATWNPVVEGLLAAMSHGAWPSTENPAWVAHCDVDWGLMLSLNRFKDVPTRHTPAATGSNTADNSYGACFNSRGLLVGFGSRSDKLNTPLGSVYSTANPGAGAAATWVSQQWEDAFPAGTTLPLVPRCLGLVDGVNATGQRVILAVAQGPSTAVGSNEIAAGGLYRKVVTTEPNTGTWSEVGGPTLFAGNGAGDMVEPDLYWPAGSAVLYAWDRQTGLWRGTNYGATWARISTETTSAMFTGFLAGKDVNTLFLSTSTQLLRFDNAVNRATTLPPVVVTLPPTCTRPSVVVWEPVRGGLLIGSCLGSTPVGMWFAPDADTTTTPAWTEVSGEDYKRMCVFPTNINAGTDGTVYNSMRGNADVIIDPPAAPPPPPVTSIVETWEEVTVGSTPVAPPSAFTGSARAVVVSGGVAFEGNNTVEINTTLNTGYVETPVFTTAVDKIAVDIMVYLTALPSANTRIIGCRLAGVNEGNLLLTTTGNLTLQDVSTSRDTTAPALTTGVWYRLAVMFDSVLDVCQLRVWTSSPLGPVPTYDSGVKTYTTGTNFDQIRLGVPSAATAGMRIDSVLANLDGAWPVRAAPSLTMGVGYIPMAVS